MKLTSAAQVLHVLLNSTSLKGQAQLKRQFCAWVACFDRPITSMFDLPSTDQHALVRRFRSWPASTFEQHIAAFLATSTRPVMVSDVTGRRYNARTLTAQQSTAIAAGWLA
jgi:hypothetical protein